MACDNVFSIIISLIFIPWILAADLHDVTINEISKLQNMTIDEYINYINPPAVHKFKNGDGDSVLCVKYEDQISLRSEHTSKGLRQRLRDTFTGNNSSMKECPEGSVPIMEITHEHVKAAGSVRQFLNRKAANGYVHEWATVGMRADQVHESKATFNIWQPFVQSADAFSLVQMWVVHEKNDSSFNETMEAGLLVYPSLSGDARIRFFIFNTLDNYRSSCFNLHCPGFVQEGGNFYPGMPLKDLSIYNGRQMETVISIKREYRGNKIVWAVYLEGNLVGHWRGEIFKQLTRFANRISFGGEVAVAPRSPPSKTDMGSGRFPPGGFKKAAYVKQIQLFTVKGAPITKMTRWTIATKPNCYDVKFLTGDKNWGDHIYYGGPGGDVPKCK